MLITPAFVYNKVHLLKLGAAILENKGRLGVSELGLPYNNVKHYTQVSNKKLSPDFITGFTDAEGSFMISILSDKTRHIG